MTIHDRTIKSLRLSHESHESHKSYRTHETYRTYGTHGANGTARLLRSLLRARFAWTPPLHPSDARCWNTHPPYPRGGIGAFDAPTFTALRLSRK
jgi:hypothetical protein